MKRYILLGMESGDYERFIEGMIPSGTLDATFFNRGTYEQVEVECEIEQATTDLYTMVVYVKRQIRRHDV